MTAVLMVTMSLNLAAQVAPKENLVHIKSCTVTLSPDWIILTHVPNGSEISLISVVMADATGRPRADKSMLLYGYCDVSTHAGLTKKQAITAGREGKAARKVGDWEVSYAVEAKATDYGLVIDAFRYVEDRKAYLWVRRGRMVKEANYTATEADYNEFLPCLERIRLDRTP
jgi:hypothetical protein